MSSLSRILIAFGVFVAALCTLLYLGFAMKFQPVENKDTSGATSTAALPAPLFYKSVGTAQKAGESLQKTKHLASRYTLEFKVVRERAEAEQEVDRLIDQGVQAFYTPLQNKGHVVYRVRRGVYDTLVLAKREAKRLSSVKKLQTKIIPLR